MTDGVGGAGGGSTATGIGVGVGGADKSGGGTRCSGGGGGGGRSGGGGGGGGFSFCSISTFTASVSSNRSAIALNFCVSAIHTMSKQIEAARLREMRRRFSMRLTLRPRVQRRFRPWRNPLPEAGSSH